MADSFQFLVYWRAGWTTLFVLPWNRLLGSINVYQFVHRIQESKMVPIKNRICYG
jgi:hypothetical protein